MLTVSQSLTDPDFVQKPYPFYDRARNMGPVVYWDDMNMHAAFDAATVMRLFKDKRLGRTPLSPPSCPAHLQPFRDLEKDSLLELEPPRHTRLRGLVLRAFTSRHVATLRPAIREVTNTLINDLPRGSEFDIIPTFCQPLPVRIIARLLGVPDSVAPELLAWSREMVAMYQTGVTHDVEARAGRAAGEFSQFIQDLIKQRRKNLTDDLISQLIVAEEDGQHLTRDEVVSTCILLLNAGHEATVHTLGNAIRVLIEEKLRPTAETAEAICEEVLRFEAPLHVFTRYVYEDVELPGGTTLQRGDQIALVLGAANRDPDVYDAPHVFNPARGINKHTSFGAGIHFCVGAPLARAEIEIALPALFDALPNLELTQSPRFANSYHFHKHDSLRVQA